MDAWQGEVVCYWVELVQVAGGWWWWRTIAVVELGPPLVEVVAPSLLVRLHQQ